MSKEFDVKAFEAAFAKSIVKLISSERITKAELQTLSRTVLYAVHVTGDIDYCNRLIEVLTPVNKKVAIVYFKHFAGFSFDDALSLFTKKSKKRYEEAHKLAMEFLDDPMNNIWSWAARNIEIEQKEFTLDKVTEGVKQMMKKAGNAGFSQADVMRAIIKAGVEIDTIIACMDSFADVEKEKAATSILDTLGYDVDVKA